MKIQVLGSAAAEAQPALWCDCETCEQARRLGGKDLRRRTSYCLDGDTIVDMGPDVLWASNEFGVDLRKVKQIVYTHRHEDHTNPDELFYRAPGFCKASNWLDLYGSQKVFDRIFALSDVKGFKPSWEHCKIRCHALEKGRWESADNLRILPLRANHDPSGDPFVLVLEREGKRVLICHDTGILPTESWEGLQGLKLDVVFIDCTMGFGVPDCPNGHLGVNSLLQVRDRLKDVGAIQASTCVFANHFSHNGHALHRDLEAFFAPHGIGVGYDGFVVEV